MAVSQEVELLRSRQTSPPKACAVESENRR